jgi:hypothetical protein
VSAQACAVCVHAAASQAECVRAKEAKCLRECTQCAMKRHDVRVCSVHGVKQRKAMCQGCMALVVGG